MNISNQTVSGLIDFHSRKKTYYGSQWDQKLSDYWYSSKYQKNRLKTFKNGKTQLFNSGGVVKWAHFQKKVEYPFNFMKQQEYFLI